MRNYKVIIAVFLCLIFLGTVASARYGVTPLRYRQGNGYGYGNGNDFNVNSVQNDLNTIQDNIIFIEGRINVIVSTYGSNPALWPRNVQLMYNQYNNLLNTQLDNYNQLQGQYNSNYNEGSYGGLNGRFNSMNGFFRSHHFNHNSDGNVTLPPHFYRHV